MPLLQSTFLVVKSKSLKGAIVPHSKPKFNFKSWFSGEYQSDFEHYLNDTIGFHADLIRLRNQIDFSLYRKCHSFDVEVGKNGYLIATTHLDAHLGKNYSSTAKIDSNIVMLSQLNDTLKKLNKTLLLMFAPSRGAFYLDIAPFWYSTKKIHESDYEHYLKRLANTSINILDYNSWFLQMKSTAKHPLFTKCGIHWSTYGATLAGDSLVKLIEKLRGIDLPDLAIQSIELSDSARNNDADLTEALNLIWPLENDTMAYPTLNYNKEGKTKIKSLFIGDSFFFNIGHTKIPEDAFEEYSFWYYNSSIFSNGQNNGKNIRDIKLVDEILKHDVIAIISTEVTLGDFGWGFIPNAWNVFFNPQDEKIAFFINEIKSQPAWYEEIVQKARKNNISVEAQLYDDAVYMAAQENIK